MGGDDGEAMVTLREQLAIFVPAIQRKRCCSRPTRCNPVQHVPNAKCCNPVLHLATQRSMLQPRAASCNPCCMLRVSVSGVAHAPSALTHTRRHRPTAQQGVARACLRVWLAAEERGRGRGRERVCVCESACVRACGRASGGWAGGRLLSPQVFRRDARRPRCD